MQEKNDFLAEFAWLNIALLMRLTFKIGLSVMCVGLLVWAVPTIRYYYPTWNALAVPLPLSVGGTRHDTFSVRTSERYSIHLACQEVGQFKEKWKNFLNWKEYPTLDCDISLRLLHDGRDIYSERLQSLHPGSWSAGTAFWSIKWITLPSAGRYELFLTNHTDLSYLQPTSPTLRIHLDGFFHKEAGTTAALGRLVGGFVFVIGLVIFVTGLFRKT